MSNKIITKLSQQKVALLGLGIENQALLSFWLKIPTKHPITICDRRSKKELGALYQTLEDNHMIKWRLGEKFNQRLSDFEVVFRSPGWPLFCPGIIAAKKKGTEISSAMDLFFSLCPTKNIVGVTGTKGKGTTASLIAHILKKAHKKVFLGGNIGVAPFSFLGKIKKTDWVVLELSSFQLEDLHHSPRLAVITNIYKEHLAPADPLNPNYHKSYNGYIRAKLNIAARQTRSGYLFFNRNFKTVLAKQEKYRGSGKTIFFTASKLPSRLTGNYNQENVGAAVALAKQLKIKEAVYAKAIKTFIGLEHRLEFVGNYDGIKYYDNSFATNPESTIMDLDSFKEPIILLLGGADKGANFLPLAKAMTKKVKAAILFSGTATPRIQNALHQAGYPKNKTRLAHSMPEAVNLAREFSTPGDIILLSTACASFGIFKNYKERGNLFKQYASKK